MPITIEDDVFGPAPDGDGVNETVIVQAADLAAARSALQRAVERYRHVDGHGVEHTEDDVAWHGVGGDAGRSCNYVSDITEVDGGVQVTVDCQDVIPMAMGEAYVRILQEELERAGVADAVVRVPPPYEEDLDDEIPAWVQRFDNEDERPVGFPDIELPPTDLVLEKDAWFFSGRTPLSEHDGSWQSYMTVPIDDLDAAVDFFVDTLQARGYGWVKGVRHPGEQGFEITRIAFAGGGLEIEVALLPPPALTKAHRKYRQFDPKGIARVTAFHRDPEAARP